MGEYGDPDLQKWATAASQSALNNAAVHCFHASQCSSVPLCVPTMEGSDCEVLDPHCEQLMDEYGYYDVECEDFTICEPNEVGVFVCSTEGGHESDQITTQAFQLATSYDFSSVILPSQESLPALPAAQCDLSHKPDWQDEAAYCANGTPCSEDQRRDEDAKQCNGGNEQVCRAGGADAPWCQQDYCWQQTGLGNCAEA
jgi:hypothetical protein